MRITPEELYRRTALLESSVTSLESQLNIDRRTGLINPAALSTLYEVVVCQGPVRVVDATPYRVPIDCTLTKTYINVNTVSSSGSITVRLQGSSNYDTTLSASTSETYGDWSVSLTAGTILIPKITAAGTDAEDLTFQFWLVPA